MSSVTLNPSNMKMETDYSYTKPHFTIKKPQNCLNILKKISKELQNQSADWKTSDDDKKDLDNQITIIGQFMDIILLFYPKLNENKRQILMGKEEILSLAQNQKNGFLEKTSNIFENLFKGLIYYLYLDSSYESKTIHSIDLKTFFKNGLNNMSSKLEDPENLIPKELKNFFSEEIKE